MTIQINQFVANLSFLFLEKPFMERFAAAKEAGFDAVEFMFPYDENLDEIAAQLETLGLKLVLFNLPAGDWSKGDRGIAIDSARQGEFRKGVAQAIEAAKHLKVSQINCLVGKIGSGQSPSELWPLLVDNIRFAADQLREDNLRLMIEPINHWDMPGFYLNTTDQVLRLIDEVDRPNVFLQFDVYHAARENEDILRVLTEKFSKIGHIQIADSPGRHQPGTGDLDYQSFFSELTKTGYAHAIALEYIPDPDTLSSLEWVKKYTFK